MNGDASPPPLGEPPVVEPKSIKVFGVLNIVFGSLGAVFALMGIVVLIFLDPLLELLIGVIEQNVPARPGPAAGDPAVVFEAMRTMMNEMMLANWINYFGAALLAVLILVSGAKLLKRRRDAVGAANLYAWTSLGFKLLGVLLYLTVIHGALMDYYDTTMSVSGRAMPAGGAAMLRFQKVMAVLSSLTGYALAAVYPVLVLVFLNKPAVRDFLARRGT